MAHASRVMNCPSKLNNQMAMEGIPRLIRRSSVLIIIINQIMMSKRCRNSLVSGGTLCGP